MAYGNSFQRALYYAVPAPLKDAMTSAYGWRERRERYGAFFQRHLLALLESQYWSNERLLQDQQERVARFVREAIASTPYYGERAEYRDHAASGRIESFPLLSKQAVRDHQRALFSRSPGMACRMVHTSGTTGRSLVFPITMDSFQREYSFREVHYSWGGVSLTGREPFAFCAGHPVAHPARTAPPFWTRDRVNNHLFLSSYHLSERNLPHYVHALESFDPAVLAGYPSSAYLLALAYCKHGHGRLKLKAVYTFSETLTDFQRQAIQDAFECRVFNWYGNTELCANIVECEQGELHLKLEHSAVEILSDRNQPCRPGETGRLVCTGFGNAAFPLIRYEVGDVVKLAANPSSRCGRGGVLVEQVLGRLEDYVVTPDGRLVGRLDHLFKDSLNIVEAQVCQDTVDEVVLRVVKDRGYTDADERAVLAEARARLGDAAKIRFDYVTTIPRGPTGKFRFVVSSLDQQQILKNLK